LTKEVRKREIVNQEDAVANVRNSFKEVEIRRCDGRLEEVEEWSSNSTSDTSQAQ
jgi:hypothetical protein